MAKALVVERESDLNALSQQKRDEFLEAYRGPIVEIDAVIGAAPLQGHFKRYYYHTLKNSHVVLVVGRAELEDKDVSALEKMMLDRIKQASELFATESQQLQAIIDAQGITDKTSIHHPEANVRAIVVGPVAKKYLDLIQQASALFEKYMLMWTLGEISGDQCTKQQKNIKNKLKGVVNHIAEIRTKVLNLIEDKKRAKHAEVSNKGDEATAQSLKLLTDGAADTQIDAPDAQDGQSPSIAQPGSAEPGAKRSKKPATVKTEPTEGSALAAA